MNDQPDTQPQDGAHPERPKGSRSRNAGSFPKGRSGNPKGRPRGSGKRTAGGSAYQVLLDKTVTATIGGKIREMSIEEAIRHRTFQDALAGKPKAVGQVLEWSKERDAWLKEHRSTQPSQMKPTNYFSPDPENADPALMILGITRLDTYRTKWGLERSPLSIEQWAVQLALRRNRDGAGSSQRDWEEIKRCTQDFEMLIPATSQSPGGTDGQP